MIKKRTSKIYYLPYLAIIIFLALFQSCNTEKGGLRITVEVMMPGQTVDHSDQNTDTNFRTKQELDLLYEQTSTILLKRLSDISDGPEVKKMEASHSIEFTLPGTQDTTRVIDLIVSRGQLEFWETHHYNELASIFVEANKHLGELSKSGQLEPQITNLLNARKSSYHLKTAASDTIHNESSNQGIENPNVSKLLSKLNQQNANSNEEYTKENPLNAYLKPAFYQGANGQYYASDKAIAGYASIEDTARVNCMLEITSYLFPWNVELKWSFRPEKEMPGMLQLYTLKSFDHDMDAALEGGVIEGGDTEPVEDGFAVINLRMNETGTNNWRRITQQNIGNQIAIVFDGHVYSAPLVNDMIPNGRSSISGNFTESEAENFIILLKYGVLPTSVKIAKIESFTNNDKSQ
jgi:SecD/SecF fusion protein